jgi:hypothetical protein
MLFSGVSADILNLSTDRRQAVKRINLLDWNKKCVENVALSIDKFRTAKSILISDINKTTVIQEFGEAFYHHNSKVYLEFPFCQTFSV